MLRRAGCRLRGAVALVPTDSPHLRRLGRAGTAERGGGAAPRSNAARRAPRALSALGWLQRAALLRPVLDLHGFVPSFVADSREWASGRGVNMME